MNPITFTPEEQGQIDLALESGLSWADESLSAIRSRIKQHYLREQSSRCCYCRKRIHSSHGRVWDVEHIMPMSRFRMFMFTPLNLSVACVDCNSAKSDQNVLVRAYARFPERSEAYIIVHPHYDDWKRHIRFGGAIYAPISEKGVETIKLCKLYRFYAQLVGDPDRILDDRFEEEIDRLAVATNAREAAPSLGAIAALLAAADQDDRAAIA